ncbi:type I restriction-modification system subunit M [Myxococcota bacterium]|nr:type I restriction-modification system subunit M [Myxococcota bacterium]
MRVKKQQLYASLWKSCDELRGGMDASQYKDYILVLLFLKYISDRSTASGLGLEVPEGASFNDLMKLRGKTNIGEAINKALDDIAKANELGTSITQADFDDDDKLGKGQAKVDRLSRLLGLFAQPGLDFTRHHADGADILGDAYEYLMRNFATESGKSKGQFYTPPEVARVMARIIGIDRARSARDVLYDPTCGSGSLLLKAFEEARHRTGIALTVYGQEMDNATCALATMNMVLHGNTTAMILSGNTLAEPQTRNGTRGLLLADYVVANPPFSMKSWSTGLTPENDDLRRFSLGVPPEKNGDFAFLLHCLASMKPTGSGCIVLPHGVLFRGNAEARIRQALIERGYLKGIIGLPPNLFYGTGIPACLIVLDKREAKELGRDLFMVDASRGFVKDGAKNRLREMDLHKIVDVFNRGEDVPGYARRVPYAELVANDFNLNLPRYINSGDAADEHDLQAHMSGGLPTADLTRLDSIWSALPGLREALLAPAGRPDAVQLRVAPEALAETITQHPATRALHGQLHAALTAWLTTWTPRLRGLSAKDKPKVLIEELSNSLLAAIRPVPCIDAYEVYEGLRVFWAAAMSDDVDWIRDAGWRVFFEGERNADLIPDALLIRLEFATEQAALDALLAHLEQLDAELEALDEEHGGEDGLLAPAKLWGKTITAKLLRARLATIAELKNAEEGEIAVLGRALTLLNAQKKAQDAAKLARKDLDQKLARRLAALTEDEVRDIVVNHRWIPAITEATTQAARRVTQHITDLLTTLHDRYARPLPTIEAEVAALSERVGAHLRRLGVVWS